tara:strand:- start:237 stop:1802 length:1566 start_codon:yes stop_codon:yes gene_type:complete
MVKKKVFYAGCKEFFYIDIAKKLLKEKNLEPVYWTANIKHKEKIVKEFPGIVFLDNFYAVRGYVPEILKKEYNLFKSSLINLKLLKLRKISSYMLERFNWNNSFEKKERSDVIDFHINFADFITEKYKPEIVIFQEVPHFVYDYILYEICKIKKIKTLIFGFTNISGFAYVMNNIWHTSKKLNYNYKKNLNLSDKENFKLDSFNKEYLRIKNKVETEPPSELWIKKKIEQNISTLQILPKLKKIFFSNFKTTFENLGKLFKKNSLTNASNMKLKNKSFKEFPSYIKIFFNIKKSEKKTLRLKKYYNEISNKVPNFKNNYINFFIHYEPERTISPQAGLLYDQISLIDYISKQMPKGWYLYVKEHPKTFSTHHLMRNQYRSKLDYDKLLKNKNIIFINQNYPSLNLIKNSKANITGSGSAGLESIIHLKPLMSFGYSWTNQFNYTLNIRTKNKLKKAIKLIEQNKVNFTEKDTLIFLKSLEQSSYNMYYTSGLLYELNISLDHKQNIEQLTNSIIDYYDNYF